MIFPKFKEENFIGTRKQIHSIAKVIGKFREKLVEPIAKNDNLWLTIVKQGFCTPPMGELNELEIGCNLEKMIIEIANVGGKYESFGVKNKTQSRISDELVLVLNDKFGIKTELGSPDFDNSNVIEISENDVIDFLAQFVNYSELLKSFHKSIQNGVKTNICLWPHHFDNAFKWFSGRKIDEHDEQIGIGVSNGDETYELPYVYMTLWPELRKTNTLEIPDGAILHDYGWSGLILPYESVLEKNTEQEQFSLINNFLEVSFKSIQRGFSKR